MSPDPSSAPSAERPAPLLVAVALVVLIASSAAVAAGLGRALLGPGAPAWALALLYVPGVLAASLLFGVAAHRVLSRHAPRWVPFEAPAATPRTPPPTAELPTEAPLVRSRRPPSQAPALSIVHLGPTADPAWAAWALRWEAPGHGAGLVPLPPGTRVVLGRDPAADIVARLDQVSWHHLELDVQEGRVTAFDLGSSNGTRPRPDAEPAPARTPIPWPPGEALHLAHPVALTLTLEPLR